MARERGSAAPRTRALDLDAVPMNVSARALHEQQSSSRRVQTRSEACP